MEQRVNTIFCFNLCETPTETYEMLPIIYGDETISRSSVFEWFEVFKRFKDRNKDFQNYPRRGRRSASRNADIIANVREMVTRDRRWALR
jgi:hypothetical protein